MESRQDCISYLTRILASLAGPFQAVASSTAGIAAFLTRSRLRSSRTVMRRCLELAERNCALERSVQEQAAQLERLDRLKRFFSRQLADAIVAENSEPSLGMRRREVTVVFIDLRGFTAFADTTDADEVMRVLREYHAAMGACILNYEGTLERFTGDGMMVFFNDPLPVLNPAERAVRMALAMRSRVEELLVDWRRRGYDLAIGIGIAQGLATVGTIGFEGRWDYGAIGTVTNLAARLCADAEPGQILGCARVARDVEEIVETERLGPRRLKGFRNPVDLVEIRGLAGSSALTRSVTVAATPCGDPT